MKDNQKRIITTQKIDDYCLWLDRCERSRETIQKYEYYLTRFKEFMDCRPVDKEMVILWKSVLKSSMLTIITLLALSIGSLLGGTAIIESIFMWDGVGKLAVDAITMRDYPLIQAYVVWMAIIYVMVNLITDLLYHALDPRIRLGVSEV